MEKVLRQIVVSSALGFSIGALLSVYFESWWYVLVGAVVAVLSCEPLRARTFWQEVRASWALRKDRHKNRILAWWAKNGETIREKTELGVGIILTSITVLLLCTVGATLGMKAGTPDPWEATVVGMGSSVIILVCGHLFSCSVDKHDKHRWSFPLCAITFAGMKKLVHIGQKIPRALSSDMQDLLKRPEIWIAAIALVYVQIITLALLVIVVVVIDGCISLLLAVSTDKSIAAGMGALVGGTIHYLCYPRSTTVFLTSMAISALLGVGLYFLRQKLPRLLPAT